MRQCSTSTSGMPRGTGTNREAGSASPIVRQREVSEGHPPQTIRQANVPSSRHVEPLSPPCSADTAFHTSRPAVLFPVFVARRNAVPAGDEALKSAEWSDTFGERARSGGPTADPRLRAHRASGHS